jgi:hypothetical protein
MSQPKIQEETCVFAIWNSSGGLKEEGRKKEGTGSDDSKQGFAIGHTLLQPLAAGSVGFVRFLDIDFTTWDKLMRVGVC